jgi:hypothetical protein
MLNTVIAYTLTLAAVFFPINVLFIGLIGGLLGRVLGRLAGALMACLLLWQLIAVTWVKFEGGVPPVAVLVAAIGLLFYSVNDELTELAKDNIAAEQWAIIIFGVWLMYSSDVIRWF